MCPGNLSLCCLSYLCVLKRPQKTGVMPASRGSFDSKESKGRLSLLDCESIHFLLGSLIVADAKRRELP
jgi:hypothetical protein